MRLTLADKVLIGGLIVVAIIGIGWHVTLNSRFRGQTAEIYKDGRLIDSLVLRSNYRQVVRVGTETDYDIIESDNGRVRVVEADCPDQLCVRMGWINSAPAEIVCMPNRVVVKVVSKERSDIDEIAR
ncbi:MAG: hypothetical protein H6Q74_439 [Firmicutes bacterium]|nr:hypothetical protein [Bacillota bacterium]